MRILTAALLAVLVAAGSTAARADYFYWTDPATGASASYPDTWAKVSNQGTDDILTVRAPSGRAHASCSLSALEDRRNAIYPRRYDQPVQQIDFSLSYIEQYVRRYDEAAVYSLHDGSGLGQAWAAYAEAGYKSAVQGPYMSRRALIFVGLYNDVAYIVECSAHKDAFEKWQPAFLSFAKTVTFKPADAQWLSGYYREFTKDERMQFRDAKDKYFYHQ